VPNANLEYTGSGRTLKYINPTCAEEITFLNASTDPDGNPLDCSLYVDDTLVATSRRRPGYVEADNIYSAKLAASQIGTRHTLRLDVVQSEKLLTIFDRSSDADASLPNLFQELFNAPGDLSHEWSINNRRISSDRDCSIHLPPGQYEVALRTSDGMKEDAAQTLVPVSEGIPVSFKQVLEVDPDNLPEYPNKNIDIPIKGVNYQIFLWKHPTESEMDESLNVIKNQLDCNGLQIMGETGTDELLIRCTEMAIDKGFETIVVSPRYYKEKDTNVDNTIDEDSDEVVSFSKELEKLRGKIDLALCVGWEWEVSLRGIATSATYEERVQEMFGLRDTNYEEWKKTVAPYIEERLNFYLERVIKGVRKDFGGKLIYSNCEGTHYLVHWDDLDLDILGPMLYYDKKYKTEQGMLELISWFRSHHKPVYVTEFGCFTYEGASLYGGDAWRQYHGQKYSQKEQAQSIGEQVELFDKGKLDGMFLHAFNLGNVLGQEDAASCAIMKNDTSERKEGFYSYKRYVRT
jgi:hypothetical protein